MLQNDNEHPYDINHLKEACRLYRESKSVKDRKEAVDLICCLVEQAPYQKKQEMYLTPEEQKNDQNKFSLVFTAKKNCEAYLELSTLSPDERSAFREARAILISANVGISQAFFKAKRGDSVDKGNRKVHVIGHAARPRAKSS